MIKTRILNESFTHNNFKTYDECKRKYYYTYIKKLYWPNLYSSYELGLTIHKLLDYQAKGFEIKQFVSAATEEVKQVWTYIENSDIMKYEVIDSEWAFNVRLNNPDQWIQGRIDRLSQITGSDQYIIIDFKTGQNIPSLKKEDWQSIIYLYGVSVSKNIDPDNLEFWYYKVAKDIEVSKIKYSKEQHLLNTKKISDKVVQIKNTTNWLPNKNCQLKLCQYKELCH